MSRIVVLRAPPEALARITARPASAPKPRERGRPGRKKRVDPDAEPAGPAPRNPKSLAGVVAAQVRALDKSGTPARRWTKRPLALKAFTQVAFTVRGWAADGAKTELAEASQTDKTHNGTSAASAAAGSGDAVVAEPALADGPAPAAVPVVPKSEPVA